MKKAFLIIAAATLVISCANDSVRNDVITEDIPIGFGNAYIGKITKANFGEMTASNTNGVSSGTLCTEGNTMEVWGWKYNANNATTPYTKVFDNEVVTYHDNPSPAQSTTNWVYSPLRFWDRAASYKFYAVAPDGKFTMPVEDLSDDTKRNLQATSVPTIQILENNNGTEKIKLANAESSVAGTASTAIDYLVSSVVNCAATATYQGNDANDKDVNFTFNHILSKLVVKVVTTDNFNHSATEYPNIQLNELTLKISGLANTWNQKTAGALNAAATDGDQWTGASSAETTRSFYADGTTVTRLLLSNTAQDVASYFIAPTKTGTTDPQLAAGTSTVQVQVGYRINYAADGDVPYEDCLTEYLDITGLTSFVQNTVNNLTVTIDPKAIYFDVESVNDWTNGTNDGTVTVE